MLLWRVVEYAFYLPFAGIILIRSYGSYLSRPEGYSATAPREMYHAFIEVLHGRCKDTVSFFYLDVTFSPTVRTIEMEVYISIEA